MIDLTKPTKIFWLRSTSCLLGQPKLVGKYGELAQYDLSKPVMLWANFVSMEGIPVDTVEEAHAAHRHLARVAKRMSLAPFGGKAKLSKYGAYWNYSREG